MDMRLRNRVAVIIGGNSGIGLATARSFAAEGADVAIWDRAGDVAMHSANIK